MIRQPPPRSGGMMMAHTPSPPPPPPPPALSSSGYSLHQQYPATSSSSSSSMMMTTNGMNNSGTNRYQQQPSMQALSQVTAQLLDTQEELARVRAENEAITKQMGLMHVSSSPSDDSRGNRRMNKDGHNKSEMGRLIDDIRELAIVKPQDEMNEVDDVLRECLQRVSLWQSKQQSGNDESSEQIKQKLMIAEQTNAKLAQMLTELQNQNSDARELEKVYHDTSNALQSRLRTMEEEKIVLIDQVRRLNQELEEERNAAADLRSKYTTLHSYYTQLMDYVKQSGLQKPN